MEDIGNFFFNPDVKAGKGLDTDKNGLRNL